MFIGMSGDPPVVLGSQTDSGTIARPARPTGSQILPGGSPKVMVRAKISQLGLGKLHDRAAVRPRSDDMGTGGPMRARIIMANDKNIRGPVDARRINIHEDYEVGYWTDSACMKAQLVACVKRLVVGGGAVERYPESSP